MARDFIINGECLVKVKGSASSSISTVKELGLAEKEVRILPIFKHHDILSDDFGPDIPAEVLWMLTEIRINMVLIHYDQAVLDECMLESMGGTRQADIGLAAPIGKSRSLVGAGLPMGGGQSIGSEKCHYISLGLSSPVFKFPWRFRACYLAERPLELPLGTNYTLASLNWRAIPYREPFSGSTASELTSKNTVLWDHNDLT